MRRWQSVLALAVTLVLVTVVHGWPDENAYVDAEDSAQYLAGAYHLATQGVYSELPRKEPVDPGLGREPGYSSFVSLIMRLDRAFAHYDPACLAQAKGCGGKIYRSLIIFNGLFIALAGLMAYTTVGVLGGETMAKWLAGAHIWLNFQAAKSAIYALSDYLALALVAGVTLALVMALRAPSSLRWLVAGFVAALLSLVKAVFLYAVLAGLAIAVVIGLWRRIPLSKLAMGLAAFSIAFGLPVGSWMARNAALGGGWTISVGRTATVLSTREVFDHMTPAQYPTAFLYWTRGFGDNLARDYLPESLWGPFEIANPNGFYLHGQRRTGPMIGDIAARDGISLAKADKRVAAEMVERIAERPVSYVLSTFPLIWRGLWVDEFVVLSFPALVWLAIAAFRAGRLDLLAALTPGAFSLVFYSLVSLNIPRYQIAALPALAIAFGFGMTALVDHWPAFRKRLAWKRR